MRSGDGPAGPQGKLQEGNKTTRLGTNPEGLCIRSGESCGPGKRARYSPVCLAPPARQRRRGSSTPPPRTHEADPQGGPKRRPKGAHTRRGLGDRSPPHRPGPVPAPSPQLHIPSATYGRPPPPSRAPRGPGPHKAAASLGRA